MVEEEEADAEAEAAEEEEVRSLLKRIPPSFILPFLPWVGWWCL